MGKKLSTASPDMEKTPTVHVRGEKGQYFIGALMKHKQVNSKFKDADGNVRLQDLYEFAIEDTDMDITGEAEAGATVSIFAPTRLNNALRQAELGQRIKIVYLGVGKATGKGGKPHTYDVEIL